MAEDRVANVLYPIDTRVKRYVTVKKRFKKIGQKFDPETAPEVENVYTFPLDENFTTEDLRRKGMVEIDIDKADPAGFEEMKRLARIEIEQELADASESIVKTATVGEVETADGSESAADIVEMEVGGDPIVAPVRCSGTVKSGARCKRDAIDGTQTCRQHN